MPSDLPDQAGTPDVAASAWCVVANLPDRHFFGPGRKEARAGTKHLNAGAKIYLVTLYQGSGGDDVIVIGRHRHTHRFFRMSTTAWRFSRWRVELVRSPFLLKELAEHGDYTRRGAVASDSPAAKTRAEDLAKFYTRHSVPYGLLHQAIPGPLPDHVKQQAIADGPVGLWAAMPARPCEAPGPWEVRFKSNGLSRMMFGSFPGPHPDPVLFRWSVPCPGRIRITLILPGRDDEGWEKRIGDTVVLPYEFRLVVTPTAAFEALAEVGREGFWRSPAPLLWAGEPFGSVPEPTPSPLRQTRGTV